AARPPVRLDAVRATARRQKAATLRRDRAACLAQGNSASLCRATMIYVHEVHEVLGGRMEEFGEAMRGEWRPLVEEGGRARLLWFWQLTHGTGASYQAVSLTAVRDWAARGELSGDPRLQAWQRRGWALRREVTAKILLPVAWSPLEEADLAAAPVAAETDSPSLYLHDTGWPFPGKLEEYVAALRSTFYPQTRSARMISVAACWTVAPGPGRPPGPAAGWRKGCATAIAGSRSCSAAPAGRRGSDGRLVTMERPAPIRGVR